MGFFYVYLIHRKEEINMIKGLAITPPILGRISIGKMVEKMVNVSLKRMTNLP
jgi:hypothetical protein